MADRFYLNCELTPGPVHLDGSEAHHLTTVRRFRPGDQVILFNGNGYECPARIEEVSRRSVSLEILECQEVNRELPFLLTVAAPLPKGDRSQVLLEKLTELGVSRFIPLRTKHTVVLPRESKIEKLGRFVIEASKQCGRNVLMEIGPLTEWEAFCHNENSARQYIAQPGGGPLPGDGNPEAIVVAIGPEGGFTDEEVESARASEWQAIDLGPRVLRVETAAIALSAHFALGQSFREMAP